MKLILVKMMIQSVMLKLRAIVRHTMVNRSLGQVKQELQVPLVVLA